MKTKYSNQFIFLSAVFTLWANQSHCIGIVVAQSQYTDTAHEPLPCRYSNLGL
jgi:hypothetical protein